MTENVGDVYSEWTEHVNMSASELEEWADDDCSREASQDPEEVIERNLRLLQLDKDEWGDEEIDDANQAISFVSRMNSASQKPEDPEDGTGDCPSEWVISLRNWGYDPLQ